MFVLCRECERCTVVAAIVAPSIMMFQEQIVRGLDSFWGEVKPVETAGLKALLRLERQTFGGR